MRPTRLNVLFADDDPVLGKIVEAAMRQAGWTVTVARDAMQAVMFAVRTPPDIVVLDITMPGGNGIAALQKLKASDKTRYVPVLVLSGTQDPALPARVVDLGAIEFWPKPVDVETLAPRLRALVDAAQLLRDHVLDAVSQLAKPAGTDAETVHDHVTRKHGTAYPVAAIEGALEQLRLRRKIVKQQQRWFLA